jgi:hypothetical protein
MTIPVTARGVAKTLAFLQETTYGTKATGTSQILRRNQSMINLQVQEIDSQEILPSQQVRDARQGTRLVQGQLMAQLSCLTYEQLIAALFRSSFVSGVSMSAQTVTVTVVANVSVTLGVSGNPLTTGMKVGDVINLTGFLSTYVGNNGVYLSITGLNATTITCAPPVNGTIIAASSQTAITISVVGKKIIMPLTYASAALNSYTFEHWYADIAQSEMATGCRITSLGISVPPSGIVGANFGFTGQQLITNATQQLASPNPVTTTNLLTAVQGTITYLGAPIAYVTGFNLQISSQADNPPVVGSPYTPNIYLGNLMASGSLTILFAADGTTNAFLNEQEFQIQLYLTDSTSSAPNFVNIFLPRVKIFADNKNDGTMEITRSVTFKCLEQDLLGGTGLAYDDTTVTIQDSLAV